jgi:glycosyltransferase involved in cell wall biosynthesis
VVTSFGVRVLVDYRPALRQRTGVGEYVHELVRACSSPDGPRAPGDQLGIFTASWADRPLPAQLAALSGVRLVDRHIPARALTLAWNRLGWPPVERLAGPVDVVHAASPVAIPTRNAACVLTIHDLHFLRHPERMAAEMRRDFPRLVAKHAREAPAILVSSAYTAADVQHTLGIPADRIVLCPPGPPPWAAAVRARRAKEPRRHFLFVGTLEPRKNVGTLLDAYAALRSRRPQAPPLVIAGHVPPTAAAWQARTTAPDLAGHVRLGGYVTEATRHTLYAEAHALILPSLDEGFGLPVLEAMACGVPVVVSTGGSLPEVAGGAARPLDPADVEGFARAMEELLDPEAAAAAEARGLQRATAFDWRVSAHTAWRAYRTAAERGR